MSVFCWKHWRITMNNSEIIGQPRPQAAFSSFSFQLSMFLFNPCLLGVIGG